MNFKKLIESLSKDEIKIIPHLEEKNIEQISKKSNLNKIAVLRSLEYLNKKKIVNISKEKRKIVQLGVNGILYRKKFLPERRLLNILAEKRILLMRDAQKESGLSIDEFKASIGILKRKGLIDLRNGKIIFSTNQIEISKKMPEEIFLDSLPKKFDSLREEEKYLFKQLQNRKEIVEMKNKKEISLDITELGRKIINSKIRPGQLIEKITPEILEKESNWKSKKFRRYDIESPVPQIYGGKRHFVNASGDYARRIWTEMGFEEMSGNLVQNSFWNFDALFTAQDHPVREMQDTFFLGRKGSLPDKELVKRIKDAHEGKIKGSRGWEYSWDEEKAKEKVLRTHTTCLSAQTISKLNEKDLPKKFFSVGKCFRNETIDLKHGFEFNQTEGIVIDENANFRNLLGYLKEFAKKMGFEKVRFRPSYFPYTEPSLEGDVWNEEKKEWVEVFAAGIFRPEVTIPLIGKPIPILAWGPGFDRIIQRIFDIKDLRELYKNNITKLRKQKFLMK
jgi:phenylalanyl-tRNA synthetase alpha chain